MSVRAPEIVERIAQKVSKTFKFVIPNLVTTQAYGIFSQESPQ